MRNGYFYKTVYISLCIIWLFLVTFFLSLKTDSQWFGVVCMLASYLQLAPGSRDLSQAEKKITVNVKLDDY